MSSKPSSWPGTQGRWSGRPRQTSSRDKFGTNSALRNPGGPMKDLILTRTGVRIGIPISEGLRLDIKQESSPLQPLPNLAQLTLNGARLMGTGVHFPHSSLERGEPGHRARRLRGYGSARRSRRRETGSMPADALPVRERGRRWGAREHYATRAQQQARQADEQRGIFGLQRPQWSRDHLRQARRQGREHLSAHRRWVRQPGQRWPRRPGDVDEAQEQESLPRPSPGAVISPCQGPGRRTGGTGTCPTWLLPDGLSKREAPTGIEPV